MTAIIVSRATNLGEGQLTSQIKQEQRGLGHYY